MYSKAGANPVELCSRNPISLSSALHRCAFVQSNINFIKFSSQKFSLDIQQYLFYIKITVTLQLQSNLARNGRIIKYKLVFSNFCNCNLFISVIGVGIRSSAIGEQRPRIARRSRTGIVNHIVISLSSDELIASRWIRLKKLQQGGNIPSDFFHSITRWRECDDQIYQRGV